MKKDTKNLIELLKYYKKYKFLSIGVIVLSLTYAGISLLSPIYEGKMLGLFENFDKTNIIKIALFLLILRIMIEIVTNLWSRVVLKLNGKVNFDLKRDMLESLTNFEVKNFDNTNSGLFISRLNKDTTELSQLFDDITDDLSGIILNISFIIYVLYLNVHLGIFLILNVILVYILTSKKLFYYKRTKQDYKEKDEKVVGLYTDIIRGIREIKDLNLKSVVLKDANKKQLETIKANNIKGNIEFKNVEFQYNSNKLFKNLNLKIESNKMIAIVGRSGEGKSTILKLISKGYSVDGGEILIDNYNINDLSEKTIKDNISVVSQSPYIFNLSIKDNIKLANPTATDEEIIEVCKKAQIHDIIDQMEKGYNTLVGENGVILSGGQKQRIAIARALIKKSKIILLDEATSSLDNSNQEKIKNVIKELSKDHTVIIVAHRLSTIVDSDNIFVVNKHKICASGTHTELMNSCEEYRNLYEIEE